MPSPTTPNLGLPLVPDGNQTWGAEMRGAMEILDVAVPDAAASATWGNIGGTFAAQEDLADAIAAAGGATAWGAITGALSAQLDLQAALDAKAAASHAHAIANVTGLQDALNSKAAVTHVHIIGEVTGLQDALDAKAPSVNPTLTGLSQISGFRMYTGAWDLVATNPTFRWSASGNVVLSATGTAGVFFNYDHGTGGVNFCNGAGVVTASISGAGALTATDATISSATPTLRLMDTTSGRIRYLFSDSDSIGFLSTSGSWTLQHYDNGDTWISGGLSVTGDIQQTNATYVKTKTVGGVTTRILGVNSGDTLYLGAVDTTFSGGLFYVNNGATQLQISASGQVSTYGATTVNSGGFFSYGASSGTFRLIGGTNNPGLFITHNESTRVTRLNASGSTSGVLELATDDVPRLTINESGVSTFTGTLNADGDSTAGNVLHYRGVVSYTVIDYATANGFYTKSNPTDSEGLLTFNAGGSLGPLQMVFGYQGGFQFRNKTDSATWTPWRTVLTLQNVDTNAATLQAAVASATAPLVGTHAQMAAYPAASSTNAPYWYATDDVEVDGLLGKLWRWNGSSWVAVGAAQTVVGRVIAGVISAGAVGAQALAADIAMIGHVLRSTGFTAGTASVAPTGFKFSGTGFTATYLDGTTDTVFAELGANMSIGGLKAATIANRVRGNNFEQTGTGTLDVFIPDGVTTVEVMLQAAGGNGYTGAGMGGSGGQYLRRKVTVKPHNTYRITIAAVGSNSTFSWVSFDGTSGFTTDSGFATITATCGANGTSGSGTGNAGTSNPNPYESPEDGWTVAGGTGGDGGSAAGNPGGAGGAVGAKTGGTSSGLPTYFAGGGGGASALANGGSGALDRNHSTGVAGNGSLGSGGGSGYTPGTGGTGKGRARWGV